jgi:hypothetical protein
MTNHRVAILTSLAALTALLIGAATTIFFVNRFRAGNGQELNLLPLGETPQAVYLTVADSGIVAVTSRQLYQMNLPFEQLSIEYVKLTRDGVDVPYFVSGEGPEAVLYFNAANIRNNLDEPSVYRLSPGKGISMLLSDGSVNGQMETIGHMRHIWEDDSAVLDQASGDDLRFGSPLSASSSWDFPLTDILPTAGPGKLTLGVRSSNQSMVEPDQHLEISLNQQLLVDYYWHDIKKRTIDIQIPPGVLNPEANQMIINAPDFTDSASESIYIDWVALEYDGVLDASQGPLRFTSSAENFLVKIGDFESFIFDITDPDSPVLLLGALAEGGRLAFSGRGEDRTYYITSFDYTIPAAISPAPP